MRIGNKVPSVITARNKLPVSAEAKPTSAKPLAKVKPFNQSNPLTVLFGLETRYGQWMHPTPRVSEPTPWPTGIDWKKAPVYAHNETFIPGAKPEDVFKLLTDASRWSAIYPNATNVKVQGGGPLQQGSTFTWRTFAQDLKSKVTLYEPNRALGWTFEKAGVRGFHRWFVKPENGGVRLVTEEVELGIAPTLSAPVMNRGLAASHQVWVEQV